MARIKVTVPPSLKRIFNEMGEKIHLARLRRRHSAELVSERAAMTRKTLRAIERGDPSVSLGAYAKVLLSLGLEKDLILIANDDILGRRLQDANLTVKKKAPRTKQEKDKS